MGKLQMIRAMRNKDIFQVLGESVAEKLNKDGLSKIKMDNTFYAGDKKYEVQLVAKEVE